MKIKRQESRSGYRIIKDGSERHVCPPRPTLGIKHGAVWACKECGLEHYAIDYGDTGSITWVVYES